MAEGSWYYVAGGQQRGPVSVGDLKQGILSGAISSADLVWRDGMAEWAPANRVAELGVASVPPPMPTGPVQYMPAGGHRASPDIGQNAGVRMLLPVGRSGWAIAAGYLGLFSILACPAPIAVVVAFVALADIKKHPDRHGLGRAWFGMVMGVLGTIGLLFGVAAMVLKGH